jgi:trehalose 6-phosphate phosphatase
MTPENRTGNGKLALTPELREAIRTIARTDHLLVAMDFDGTMAPIVGHADDARPLPRAATAFAGLAVLPRTTTALISGRALASLRQVASPPVDTLLIGSHGAEAWLGPGSAGLTLDDTQKALLAEVRTILADIVAEAPGTMLEDKPPAWCCIPARPQTTWPRTQWQPHARCCRTAKASSSKTESGSWKPLW